MMARVITEEDAKCFADDIENVCVKHGLSVYAVYADEIIITEYNEGCIKSLRNATIDGEYWG